MNLQSYDQVIDYLNKNNRAHHLLLGNGFSVAYDKNIFSYTALHKFIQESDDPTLTKLFGAVKTKNFELIMQQLETFTELLQAFDPGSPLIEIFSKASDKLKLRLIEAIKELHPDHVFKIDETKSVNCAKFISEFIGNGSYVFTTNYDILLYWILLRNNITNHCDGFGRDLVTPGDARNGIEPEYSELRWGRNSSRQNTFYLHGALPIFDTGGEIVKEEYTLDAHILDNIKSRIDNGQYPVFVTAGNGDEKLEHITHNKYLAYCYDRLAEINGSLITFGFSFGPYDDHIIHAINRAAKFGARTSESLRSVYIGVYQESDIKWIESIRHKFACKVNMYDARTAPVWGANEA